MVTNMAISSSASRHKAEISATPHHSRLAAVRAITMFRQLLVNTFQSWKQIHSGCERAKPRGSLPPLTCRNATFVFLELKLPPAAAAKQRRDGQSVRQIAVCVVSTPVCACPRFQVSGFNFPPLTSSFSNSSRRRLTLFKIKPRPSEKNASITSAAARIALGTRWTK